jgi:HSP20 family protein
MTAPAKIDVKQTTPAYTRPGFHPFGSLQREIDRLFEDFAPAFGAGRMAETKTHMDLAETKDGFELTVELPGMEEKDVSVTVSDGMLTVSGEKTFETENKDKRYHFVERGYGAFSRSLALPEGVMTDRISAALNKGVLKVVIPAAARTEPKKVEVKAG